ncbi:MULTISPECIES: hypothetical protein [Cupriavidus]|uniref:hypothetical protein n=1 Tax=Cupriavidus TaxID=106589 RepID=UPI000373FED8|nr:MULTISPECIES: hypothetical protein [Cupriavidus]
MLDLVAFIKPVLDEITGQDVRTWTVRRHVVNANWQIPDTSSRNWSARKVEIEIAHEAAEQLRHADQCALYQLQRGLDAFLRARLGSHSRMSGADGVIVIVIDRLVPF